jgi:hypothetical protein
MPGVGLEQLVRDPRKAKAGKDKYILEACVRRKRVGIRHMSREMAIPYATIRGGCSICRTPSWRCLRTKSRPARDGS